MRELLLMRKIVHSISAECPRRALAPLTRHISPVGRRRCALRTFRPDCLLAGSEIRIRHDALDHAHAAIAFETGGAADADHYPALVSLEGCLRPTDPCWDS